MIRINSCYFCCFYSNLPFFLIPWNVRNIVKKEVLVLSIRITWIIWWHRRYCQMKSKIKWKRYISPLKIFITITSTIINLVKLNRIFRWGLIGLFSWFHAAMLSFFFFKKKSERIAEGSLRGWRFTWTEKQIMYQWISSNYCQSWNIFTLFDFYETLANAK